MKGVGKDEVLVRVIRTAQREVLISIVATGEREFLVGAAEDEALIDIGRYSGGSMSSGHGSSPTPLPWGHSVVHCLGL